MPTLNERVDEVLSQHDLDLIRYANGHTKDVITQINNLQAEIINLIKTAEPKSRATLEALLVQVNSAIDRSYSAIAIKSVAEFKELATVESKAVTKITERVFRAPIAPKIINENVVLKIVDDGLAPNTSDGMTIRNRWNKQRDGLKLNTRDGLNYAIQNNQGLDDMLRIIRGNKSLNFKDWVIWKNKKAADTLVRTATDTVVNASRLATYERNNDTVKGIQVNAILDSRTTILCRTRNGWAWRLPSYRPFRGTPEKFMGPPPWHFNCRSTLSPIFGSLEDLQGVLDPALNKEILRLNKRLPIDGKPAPTPSFSKMLKSMSKAEQESVLGKGRLELYDKGKITLSDLVNQQGRTLTLAELKERYGT